MLRELALRGVDSVISRLGYIKASEVPRMAQVLFAGEGMPYQQDFMASTEAEIQKLALTNPWVYSNISLISRRVALGRLMIETQDKKGVWTEVPTHDFTQIFEERPNPYMGQMFVWMYQLFWLLLRGECYWMQVPDKGGTLRQVYPLPANRIYPISSTTELIAGFCYTPSMTGISKTLKTEHVIFNRLPNPFNYNRGLSPLTAYVLGLQTQQEAEKFDMEDYKQGLTLRHIISLRPEVSDPDAMRYQREIDEAVKLSRRFMVTRGGDIKVAPITIRRGGEDSSENVQKLSREKADYIYGIPLGLRTSDATQANATVAERTFISDTIWPLMVLLSEDLTVQSVEPYYGEGLRAAFEDVRIPDKELIMKEEKQKWEAMTYDEVREQQGLKKYFDKEIGKQKFTIVDELIKMQFEADLAAKAQEEAEPPVTIIPPEGKEPPEDDVGLEDEEVDDVPDAFIDEEGKGSEVYRWLEEGWLQVPFQLMETGSENGSDAGYWYREGYLPGAAYVAEQSEVRLWAEGRLSEVKHLPGRHSQASHGHGGAGVVPGRLKTSLKDKSQAILDKKVEAMGKLESLHQDYETLSLQFEKLTYVGATNKEVVQLKRNIKANEKEMKTIEKQYYKDTKNDRADLFDHYEIEGQRQRIAFGKELPAYDKRIEAKVAEAKQSTNNTRSMRLMNEAQDIRDEKSRRITELLSENETSKMATGKHRYYDFDGKPQGLDKELKEITNDFENTMGRILPPHAMPLRPVRIAIWERGDKTDSYAGGNIYVSPFSKKDVYVHEFGHHMEITSGSAGARSKRFYNKRTKGEEFQSLSDLGAGRYHSSEVTKVDRFIHPYMGKKPYKGSTELLSMGIEMMLADPVSFAKKDPQMFDFVYAVMKSG